MKKLSFFLLFLIFILFSQHAYCQKSDLKVGTIEIEIKKTPINQNIDTQTLLKRMKTKEGGIFSQNEFDDDLKMLVDQFDKVEPTLSFKNKEVDIKLELYPKLFIRKITFCGNKSVSTSTLLDELDIAQGSALDRYNFNEAFHKLRTYYIKNGYFEADLSYKIVEDPCISEVDIEIFISEGPSGKIRSICVEGVSECEEEQIISLMSTKEYCFFTSWYTKTGIFQPEALEHDRIIITNYLQNEGWADAKVDIKAFDVCHNEKIDLKVTVCKGDRYYFGDVTFSGNKIFCNAEIERHLSARQGCPFSPDKLRDAIKCLTDYLGSKGYIESTVNFSPSLRECQNVYDVHFTIEEGHCYRVGLVKVFGNTCTKTPVVLHESLMIPGDVFDSRKLEGTECRLKQMGYFECVNVYPVKSSQDCNESCDRFRDVHIEVKETYTGTIGAFFGFSTIESLFGGIDLTERNFNFKGIPRVISDGFGSLRGNGEYLQLKTSIGIKSSSYLLRWTKPYFMDTKWIVGFDLERSYNRAISNDYDVISSAIKLHATYSINDFLRYGWTYRLQSSSIRSGVATPPGSNTEQIYNHGTVSALGPRITYDSTDRAYNPTCGLRSELSFEYAGVGGDYNFYSAAYLNTFYYPISRRGTMKYRVDAQFIKPLGNTTASSLPLGERLFLGGETTVRGYRPFAIGPKLTNGDPKGGISSLLLSEEYNHKIFKKLDAFVFLDGGSVSFSSFTVDTIRAAYGIGLRVEVMECTPIVVGFGWPLNPESNSDVRRFFVSFGGRF
jgi:outer membrane protein insertion porin family